MTADPISPDTGKFAHQNRDDRPAKVGFRSVMNRGRWVEVARIVIVGVFVLALCRVEVDVEERNPCAALGEHASEPRTQATTGAGDQYHLVGKVVSRLRH